MLRRLALVGLLMLAWNGHAQTYPAYAVGHINNVTFAGDLVLIKLDVGLTGNCAGTAYSWMAIPAAYKPVQAFVLALQARGALSSVLVLVFTDPTGSNTYCTVTQIDPYD